MKNTFLNGTIEDEVYIDSPPEARYTDRVCKSKRALYRLKQSPRAWFRRLSIFMSKLDYKQSDANYTLFIKQKMTKITALIVYVDDMVVTKNDSSGITTLQRQLATKFKLKDLGNLKYFLGIKVARSAQEISLFQ